MALMFKPQYTRQVGSADDIKRTFNGLEVSEGAAPSNKFLVDPRVSRKFKYQFNVKQDEWVCIPKGLIVGVATNADYETAGVDGDSTPNTDNSSSGHYFKEFESQKLYHAITIANGGVDVPGEADQRRIDLGVANATYTRTANVPLGVLFKNAYYKVDDRMFGSGSSIITRSFIELPYVPDRSLANLVAWGCATGGDGGANDPGYLRPGDLVKSDAHGHFVKWNPGTLANISGTGNVWVGQDDPRQVVGQVWDVTGQLQPEGWLQWVMWNLDMTDDTDKNVEDLQKLLGLKAQDLQLSGYEYGYPALDKYLNQWRYAPQAGRGIEGLTDGANIVKSVTNQKIYRAVPKGTKANEKLYFNLPREQFVANSVKIGALNSSGAMVGDPVGVGGTYSAEGAGIRFTFDRFDNDMNQALIVITVLADVASEVQLAVNYDATGMVPGVPTMWDLKGSIGGVRILLGGIGR
jgi:hypothetical protein